MKKLVICSLLSSAALVSGLWVTRAINRQPPDQAQEIETLRPGAGLSLQKLVQKSELIVTGQCLGTHSSWIDRRLVTTATVAVGEAIKGSAAQTVNVVLPGGVDLKREVPIAMTYPGAPSIQAQEQVFLFLKPSGEVANSYAVTGYAQGKFSIVENDQGQKMVAQDLTKTQTSGGTGVVRGNLPLTPLPVFVEQVKQYVQ
ncbi:MAG TPA: hypothetical protein VJ302_17395 [Blastocatellia bacterium]|nr:hypothetical protein [Blastocatellia bacterium]